MQTKVYRFTRGVNNTYSVDVAVSGDAALKYFNIQYPDGTSLEVINKLLEDAERAVLKQLEVSDDYEKQYGY